MTAPSQGPRVFRYWLLVPLVPVCLAACTDAPPSDRIRVSGHVEATEVHTAAEVGGRLVELRVDEGDRIAAGGVIARLDTEDAALQIARTRADRAAAAAQLRLLEAGSRAEDIRQARAQVDAATADTVFQQLLSLVRDTDSLSHVGEVFDLRFHVRGGDRDVVQTFDFVHGAKSSLIVRCT